jgi:hypothetical protein
MLIDEDDYYYTGKHGDAMVSKKEKDAQVFNSRVDAVSKMKYLDKTIGTDKHMFSLVPVKAIN